MDVLDILNDDGGLKFICEWLKIWCIMFSGFDLFLIIMNMDEIMIEIIFKKIKWLDKVKNFELIGKYVDVMVFKECMEVNVNVIIVDCMVVVWCCLKECQGGDQ